MSEVTHLVCAHCGGDNPVSNWRDQTTIKATDIADGLSVSFYCQHCGKEYPLVKSLPSKTSRMKPVVEAAIKWKKGTPFSSAELAEAVDVYENNS